ncbi:MAG: hypothetical protein IJO63_01255 [Bacilli bacterium]|nr:hypothetical protein [Bacilli bacterium]
MTYNEIKGKYKNFIYEKFEVIEFPESYKVVYYFEIEGLKKFTPSLEIEKKYIKNPSINKDFLNDLLFHVGLVELVSYWKCAMCENVIIKAGLLDEKQINWFKKMYYYGLGEFMYINNIDISIEDFMHIHVEAPKIAYNVNYEGQGNLIAIGGGKDSNVSLNLLKNMYDDNDAFMINPKAVHYECAKVGGYENKSIIVKRNLDQGLIELNKEGFLNGHTPFSALVSFVSLLTAYLTNKKYIILSNESSANESNVEGTKINHQYSKSYEYECDFNNYVKDNFAVDIHYFSLLRPLAEIQIAMLFAKFKEYHSVFKSCNVGSKAEPWHWCCNCPKCLFVYIILCPFLSDKELNDIFGEDLFTKEDLLETFIELTGNSVHKPFECVGTYEEVNYAISRKIEKYNGKLPYLLEYYQKHFEIVPENGLLKSFNTENNLPVEFIEIVRGAINE